MNSAFDGICQCGCGGKTNLATKTSTRQGYIKGSPMRFIHGHHRKHKFHTEVSKEKMSGKNHHFWKGGRKKHSEGYILVHMPSHPNAGSYGYVFEHVLMAEKSLGKYLPKDAIVHHINETRDDNSPKNLVICQDAAYHNLLHMRMRALNACGNKNWRKCTYCKKYDDPKAMYQHTTSMFHRECNNEYQKKRRILNA
jgi:hypothetical protein